MNRFHDSGLYDFNATVSYTENFAVEPPQEAVRRPRIDVLSGPMVGVWVRQVNPCTGLPTHPTTAEAALFELLLLCGHKPASISTNEHRFGRIEAGWIWGQ